MTAMQRPTMRGVIERRILANYRLGPEVAAGARFPAGSMAFDCTQLMRNVPHAWHSRSPLCCEMA